MCGIAGLSGEHPSVIRTMTERLLHRGPDGHACWCGQGASLGHTRLAILDPTSGGAQPMWNDDRTIVLVFNGEIYNYRQLREKEALPCSTGTDTEVLLRLYERYGADAIAMLQGMFAVGIYDTRDRSWLLARDASGIKPLFVTRTQEGIAFASEVRALMAALPTKPAIDTTSLSHYLRLQYVPGPRTLCEGIEQLPPGTVLRYQHPQETRHLLPVESSVSYTDAMHCREDLPNRIAEAVSAQLVSDKPIGVFLSGGMDSSVILHHMSTVHKEPINTFTIRFDATDKEGASRFNTDADLARMTAVHYGSVHHELLLTADDYRTLYRDTARSLDQPNADSVSVAQYVLSRAAKEHVDVVLTGAGGDEIFGGYPRYRIAQVLQRTRMVPARMRGLLGRMTGYPPDVLMLQPSAALAERLLARPVKEIRSVVRNDWFEPEATSTLFTTRFDALTTQDPIRDCMEFDRGLWLPDESLRLTDAVTMAHGLEARVPLIDERLIQAIVPTPGSWHVTTRRTKALLKDAYRHLLPPHLYTLDKASFYPPLSKWLRRETAPLLEEALESTTLQTYVDVEAVRALHRAHCEGAYHLHLLSSMMQLGHWFQEVYGE